MSTRSARLLEVAVAPEGGAIGRPLKELGLPEGCLLVALLRGLEAIVPGAEDRIEEGDRVLLVTGDEHRRAALRLLAGKA